MSNIPANSCEGSTNFNVFFVGHKKSHQSWTSPGIQTNVLLMTRLLSVTDKLRRTDTEKIIFTLFKINFWFTEIIGEH